LDHCVPAFYCDGVCICLYGILWFKEQEKIKLKSFLPTLDNVLNTLFNYKQLKALTLVLKMTSCNSLDFVIGYNHEGFASYYSYDDKLYSIHFPKKWSKYHADGTGPKMCENCEYHGSWNGVFIGYCMNCARYIYEGSRGRGMEDGVEDNSEEVQQYHSVHDTYLKNANCEYIGDKNIFDSRLHFGPRLNLESILTHSHLESAWQPLPLSTKADEVGDSNIQRLENDEYSDGESAYSDCEDEYSIGAYDDLEHRGREDCIEYGVSRDDYGGEYGSNYDGGYDSY